MFSLYIQLKQLIFKPLLVVGGALLVATEVSAQRVTTHLNDVRQQTQISEIADVLLKSDLFGASRSLYKRAQYAETFSSEKGSAIATEEALFYEALSAKENRNGDAIGLMRAFVNNHSQSLLRDDMYYHIGNYYLAQKGDLRSALAAYDQVREKRIGDIVKDDFYFEKGYCLFMRGKQKQGLAQFDKVSSSSRYSTAIRYYRAHVDYQQGNLDAALKEFVELQKDDAFAGVAPYYIAHIFYLKGSYAEAITYAEPLINGANKKNAVMQRIIADSYFGLANYAKAKGAYETLKKCGVNMQRSDNYHYGMSLYREGDYTLAVQHLKEVTGEKDELSQNAYYFLAGSYVQLGDMPKARMAFSQASDMTFDKAIAEDAHFKRICLQMEQNYLPFADLITELNKFLEKYPETDKRDEALDYMSRAYLATKNYDQALESLENIKHKNLNIYTAMQKMSFYRGIEHYTNANYDEAIRMFAKAIDFGNYDRQIVAQSIYWTGESLYRKGKTDDAYEQYRKFLQAYGVTELPEFSTAHYNIAYTRFNRKNYNDAQNWFIKYIALNPDNTKLLADAYNRLGDCMYANRNFGIAIDNYNKALETNSATGDYSMLQRSICLGLTKGNQVKIDELKSLIKTYPTSRLCGYAYYEMARANVALENIPEAIYNYKVVKERYPRSSLASKAMVQLGLLYYNNNDPENSKVFYKRVINEYPATPQAQEALAGLRNVYMELGDFDGYMTYTQGLGAFARVETAERDSLMFVSASKLYYKRDWAHACPAFERYLEEFPEGRFVIGANFYLADCYYYTEEERSKALKGFRYVADAPRTIYTEDALVRVGELLYSDAQYAEASSYYERLQEEAENQTNKVDATIGVMRCQKQLGDLNFCIKQADAVIALPEASPEVLREAKYLKAKSLIALEREQLAVPTLKELSANTRSAEGAEAKYLLAQIYFDHSDTQSAETEVMDYIEGGTPHQYWLARSFVLLSDICQRKGDNFMALQYLESLESSYNAEDDIRGMINQRKQLLREASAATDAAEQSYNEVETAM